MSKSTSTTTSDAILRLEAIERRIERALRDLRLIRTELQRDASSKGVLGSRGLTQFIVEQLQTAAAEHARVLRTNRVELLNHPFDPPREALPARGLPLLALLSLAERAGYLVPTARTLSKRLTERSYRVGDIAWDTTEEFWYWKGDKN